MIADPPAILSIRISHAQRDLPCWRVRFETLSVGECETPRPQLAALPIGCCYYLKFSTFINYFYKAAHRQVFPKSFGMALAILL